MMFFVSAEWFYFFLTLPFIFVWIVLYVVNKNTRLEQILVSVTAAIIGPLSEIIYVRDYWVPQSIFPINLGSFILIPEDILFGFVIGGIAAVIYEVALRTRQRSVTVDKPYTRLMIAGVFFIVLGALLYFQVNSIYASSIAFVVTALPMFLWRRDLFLNALGSAIGVTLVLFVCYLVVFGLIENMEALLQEGWLLTGTPFDVRILGIPITELTWAFTMGFLVGPLYEFVHNKKLI